MCCILVCSSVIVPQHFVKYLALATSIAITGIDIGGFVSPIIMEQLLTIFRWSTVFLFIGCFVAVSSVLSITFKPVEHLKETPSEQNKKAKSDSENDLYLEKKRKPIIDTSVFKSPPIVILYVTAFIQHFMGK